MKKTNIEICWVKEKEPDFVSRMIMKFQKTTYSHVLIRFKDRHGIDSIFHATGKGVNIGKYKPFMETHLLCYAITVKLKVTEQFFWGYISGSEGKAYSQWQLLRIATGTSFFTNGKEKRICSETVGAVLHNYSKYKLEGDPDLWTPKYLLEVVSNT